MINNNKILYIIAVCILLYFASWLFIFIPQKETKPKTTLPTPTPFRISPSPSATFRFSPFQKTTVGVTPLSQVDTLPNIISKEKTKTDETVYKIKSVNPLRTDEIIVKNNLVIFERTSTFTEEPGGFPKISSYISIFGEPEEKILGSSTFGPFATSYIYASKGFVLIGNEATNNTYEIQRFLPMTVLQYKEKYGQDIISITPSSEH